MFSWARALPAGHSNNDGPLGRPSCNRKYAPHTAMSRWIGSRVKLENQKRWQDRRKAKRQRTNDAGMVSRNALAETNSYLWSFRWAFFLRLHRQL
jgi:hypothetical protein